MSSSCAKAGRRPATIDALHCGTILDGRFWVESLVRTGATCAIYRATHLHLQCSIALKVPALRGKASFQRLLLQHFFEEARVNHLAAQLHPAVARTFDAGVSVTETGTPLAYSAMEWIDGDNIEALLSAVDPRVYRVSINIAELTLRPIAAALSKAHLAGITHGDLKPSNIMIATTDSRASTKLIDFSTPMVPNARGLMMRTPAYSAPEQWLRDVSSVGPATDVHGLALICFELLTGTRFFQTVTIGEAQRRCLDAEWRRRRIDEALLPSTIRPVIDRGLRIAPLERYRSIRAFWSDFRSRTP
jgi:serine/threonine protein kinase